MSNDWQDRRGMFQRGKDVHEAGRKPSGSGGGGGVVEAVRRASVSSNTSDKQPEPTATSAARRRSSNVAFENLANLKRGSDDYSERRASHHEMHGQGGVVAGWFNKTFRGMQTTTPTIPEAKPKVVQQQDPKRGVMEWYERRTDSI